MMRRSVFPWTFATLALLGYGIRAANADPITFTGFAQNDFNPNTNQNVQVFSIDSDPLNNIAETPYMLANNRITGWAVKDLRLAVDPSTQSLYVGLNTYGIAGDADGNGDPGTVDPKDPNFVHGQDQPHLGGQKSITVAFAANNPSNPATPGAPLIVAGVPAQKDPANTGIDGFTVASYAGNNAGIQNNYGATLTGHVGNLAFDPSASHPNFEFNIPGFGNINGLNPAQGFWVQIYSGSPDDGSVGEEKSQWIHVPAFAAQSIPEPATWLAWTLLGAGVAWRRHIAGRRKVSG
jgi:hypothetical protein